MRSLPVIAVLVFASVVLTQNQDFSKVQIKTTKVSGNVYMLEGSGGNIGVLVGDDGVVMIDDQYAPLSDKIKAAIGEIAPKKPLRYVINTHYHGDHTGGNVPFAAAGATIVAHDNVRKRLSGGGTAGTGGAMSMPQPASPKEGWPLITFAQDVTVHMNGEDIHAVYYPAGHTDTDSIVFFPKNNVVHMGDDFVRYGFPFIDINGGGSVQGMIAALEKAIPTLPADVKVIPGHGALSNLDDVREYIKMLKDTSAVVEKGIKAGKTAAQMKQEKVLEPWSKWSPAGGFINSDAFIDTLYNSLTKK